MGADVVLRGAADCVRVAVTRRIGLFFFVCFFLFLVVFFDFGISFSSSGVFRALFFYVFLMTENELKMQIAPFGAAVFGVGLRLWATCVRRTC